MNKTTTEHIHISIYILLSILLRNKSLRSIALKYKLSYQSILFLISCYIYNRYISDKFTLNKISRFTCYWTTKQISKHINKLIDLSFITPLAGKVYQNYQVSDKCNDMMNEIEDSYNTTLYNFCSLHNIDL